jgi:hypothetical protein
MDEDLKKLLRFECYLILFGILVITGFFIYEEFIIPSYISMRHSFNESTRFDSSWEVVGRYYPSNNSIEILTNDTNGHILKHELCHRVQHSENRIYYSKFGRFINEVECNIAEYL